ncbi:MAG: integration host factor subunit alpha [Deltaproteobacteria bacterium]|jgi:integration host factor subunit alpha|nr:MAG: integration host factor subunit alpha [Deltaproteobacteria bacterium]
MTLTKKDIVEHIHNKIGFPRQATTELVTSIFNAFKEELLKGHSVKIANFGILKVRAKRARPGRNMRTGETVEISARSVVTFKASRKLRDALNKKS